MRWREAVITLDSKAHLTSGVRQRDTDGPMIEIQVSATTATVVISGDLDLAERDQFPAVISRVSGLHRSLVVIDMANVTFMDSTGAAFLISLADATNRRGGVAVLRAAHERDLFVLQVCGALGRFRLDDGTSVHAEPEPVA